MTVTEAYGDDHRRGRRHQLRSRRRRRGRARLRGRPTCVSLGARDRWPCPISSAARRRCPSRRSTDAGLVAGDVSEAYSDDHRRGRRHQPDPAADAEVAPGSAVGYVRLARRPRPWPCPISAAPPPMPSRRSPTPASSWVPSARPTATPSPPATSSARTPPPAPRCALGSAVGYVRSLGVETVAVPDLSGAAADAEQTLTDAGLVVGAVTEAFSDTIAAGDVISQDPAAGTDVELGSAVAYVRSLGVQTVAVPDLSGAAADAEQTLTDAGLVVGAVSEAYSDTVAAGDVISQDPAAGTDVRARLRGGLCPFARRPDRGRARSQRRRRRCRADAHRCRPRRGCRHRGLQRHRRRRRRHQPGPRRGHRRGARLRGGLCPFARRRDRGRARSQRRRRRCRADAHRRRPRRRCRQRGLQRQRRRRRRHQPGPRRRHRGGARLRGGLCPFARRRDRGRARSQRRRRRCRADAHRRRPRRR